MSTIQAIRVHGYGGPEQLRLESVPCPEPQEGEVLLRVYAIGVNPIDWKIRAGLLQDFFPKQFPYIPGYDVAGIVEGVGPGVTTWSVGQEVFGQGTKGTYAEYIVTAASALAPKPTAISFAEAAAIPVGAMTAWKALFQDGGLQAGQRVLVLGAAGGVGAFAVQLAKWGGAQVIGTASTANLAFVRSLGAEQVIDYTTTPITSTALVERAVQAVDLVIDGVGGEVGRSALAVVRRGGKLISLVEPPAPELAQRYGVETMMVQSPPPEDCLKTIARLVDEGQLRVTTGRIFPFREVREAHMLSQTGHGRGRIVLQLD
uniref:NADPH:quinone reductase n=1 Tax=Thermosporothrix sp. COM3 TaxID=2490863 RepID=A0A455SHI5_9CHLR|nr:NADPH:quinone reductase [Thermosporothrix sp. COM3]